MKADVDALTLLPGFGVQKVRDYLSLVSLNFSTKFLFTGQKTSRNVSDSFCAIIFDLYAFIFVLLI